MTEYDALLSVLASLDIKHLAQESMEFISGGMRRTLWINVPTPIGVLGFKFDTYGVYEGMYKMVERDELPEEVV